MTTEILSGVTHLSCKDCCPVLRNAFLQVVDIDIGSKLPAIHNLRALPSPTATIWPQAMFDLDYEGNAMIPCL